MNKSLYFSIKIIELLINFLFSKSDGGNSPLTGEALRVELTELLPDLPKMLFKNGNAVSNGMEPPYSVANPAKYIIGSQTKRKYKSTTDSSKVKAKKPKAPVRRSGRLQNVIMPARNKDIGPAIEDLTARDGEEVLPLVCEETRLPELSLTEKNTEEKVLSLTKDVEILKSRFEALKSKVTRDFLYAPDLNSVGIQTQVCVGIY